MDNRVIFAVAGSGKTTYILNSLSLEKRSLIVTYTNNNVKNLRNGIIEKFGLFPENITLLPYFSFLYSFCYKPFLSYKYKTKGINYKPNPNKYAKQTNLNYYIDNNKRIYSNRISKILEKTGELDNINARFEKYFDNLFIDEIQDFAGNDFNLLKSITKSNIEILFVGDFYQHTFDTSRDGCVNKNLHNNFEDYILKFREMGLKIDTTTLSKSYRCSPDVSDFINDNLGIEIKSFKEENTEVTLVEEKEKALDIFNNNRVVKLFYSEHYKYNCFSRNWGDSKGPSVPG